MPVYSARFYCMAQLIRTNDGLKRIPREDVPFRWPERYTPKLWKSDRQKCNFWPMNRTFKRERQKNSNTHVTHNLNILS